MIKSYLTYIKESKIDETFETNDRKKLLLFSDRVRKDYEEDGNKYTIFHEFYKKPEDFYALLFLQKERIPEILEDYKNNRYTLLGSVSYKDTDGTGRKKLTQEKLEYIIENNELYYFYQLVEGRRGINMAPGIRSIRRIVNSQDDKSWYFIIRKNRSCNMIKTKSREESGNWAEHQLSTIYGWKESLHGIKLKIKKNGIIINRTNNLLKTILKDEDKNNSVFGVEDDPDTFVKYDLIIDGDKKIEVKKYKEDKIWKNDKPQSIMLAEQCKVADRRTLMKIVEWFNEKYERGTDLYQYSEMLMELDERKLASLFKDKERPEICNYIQNLYNHNIKKLLRGFNKIDESRWMNGIYGIYFVSNRTNRKGDFLIKIEDEGTRNIMCRWDIVSEWAGFDRLKLFMWINGDSWEYILTERNNFVKAFKLKDYRKYDNARSRGHMILPPLENGGRDREFIYDNEYKWWVQI